LVGASSFRFVAFINPKVDSAAADYLLGFRRGMKQARKHLCAAFDDKLAELQDDYQDVIREMKSERQRYHQIKAALNTSRDPDDPWLS
jgi:hypothetical protein